MRYIAILSLGLPMFATSITSVSGASVTVTLHQESDQKLHGVLVLTIKGADTDHALSAVLKLVGSSDPIQVPVAPTGLKANSTGSVEVTIVIPGCVVPSSGILTLNPDSD